MNAQQARRILDRIVGFELSPILWRKVKPALSAGRVQSVAVRLIVEREREINEFVSEAAYRVIASFILPDGTTILKAELNRRLKDKEEVEAFLESCKDASFTIDDISKSRCVRHQPLLLRHLPCSRRPPVSWVIRSRRHDDRPTPV